MRVRVCSAEEMEPRVDRDPGRWRGKRRGQERSQGVLDNDSCVYKVVLLRSKLLRFSIYRGCGGGGHCFSHLPRYLKGFALFSCGQLVAPVAERQAATQRH